MKNRRQIRRYIMKCDTKELHTKIKFFTNKIILNREKRLSHERKTNKKHLYILCICTMHLFVFINVNSLPLYISRKYCYPITDHSTCFSAIPAESSFNVCAVSYTHLDVYKRQPMIRVISIITLYSFHI